MQAGSTLRGGAGALLDGAALGLSGGGYRASLFHLGALWRLNEIGWLKRLKRVDGVSGGAIVAAWLGLRWSRLRFSPAGVAENFAPDIAAPLRRLAAQVLDIPVGIAALVLPVSILPGILGSRLFGRTTLADLQDGPGAPAVGVLATNLLSGSLVEFTAAGIRDDKLGEYPCPGFSLATAVAASCSVPPTFRPIPLRLRPGGWRGECPPRFARTRCQGVPLRLVDGGNLDNHALSVIGGRFNTVLMSDGSSPVYPWTWLNGDWLTSSLRSNRVMIDHVRSLRIELLGTLAEYVAERRFVRWGIMDGVEEPREYALPCPPEVTERLGFLRTRMGRHTAREQGQLINWGYMACDAVMRGSVAPEAAPPAAWPIPEWPLG